MYEKSSDFDEICLRDTRSHGQTHHRVQCDAVENNTHPRMYPESE